MKILIVSDAGGGQINGVVRTLEATITELRKLGHSVVSISPENYTRTFPLPWYPEIRIPVPYDFWNWGIKNLIETQKFDAVHIATESVLGLVARKACLDLNQKFTTAYHTQFPAYVKSHFGISETIGFCYMRWFHKHSQAVMVPTETMRKNLIDNGFKNVVIWGRGVDKRLFHPRELISEPWSGVRPYWLNVGRVSVEKNLDAFLSLDLPGTKIVVGDGPDLTRLTREYPDVLFLGAKTGIDLAECYNHADVFVFPSITDTYGLVIAEAISSGCPVAAFPVAGPIDVIEPGSTGMLDKCLASACLNALYLSKHRKTIERNFSWDLTTKDFLKFLFH